MDISQRIFAVSDSVAETANEMVSQCELPVTEHGIYDPNVLAYLLLCRTRSNFAGAILLTRQRMIVEARTLARCCFENAFLVAGLRVQGREFSERMKEDDEAGRKNRLKFARDSETIYESLEPEMRQAVDTALTGLERPGLLSPKGAAKVGAFKELYLAYSQFSGDAAHPTLTALARYWRRDANNAVEIIVSPEPSKDELDQTLLFAAMSVLGILGTLDEMFGRVPAGRVLPTISVEIQAIQAAAA
jgi:uncharacterized protein DUF5677